MKIDSCLNTFVEKYNHDAMASIDAMKNNFGRLYHKHTIPLFNITESFNTFNKWIRGYSEYCVEQAESGNEPSIGIMTESFNGLMNSSGMIKKTDNTYDQISGFVQGFVEGVNYTIENINEVKQAMIEHDIDPELIGQVNEYADIFMDKLMESFDPAMDRLLWASGYNARQRLFRKEKRVEEKPVFL